MSISDMNSLLFFFCFFFSSRRRHTRCLSDWSSDVCSSDLLAKVVATGLSEFQSASQQVSDSDVIDAAKRGLERSVAIVHAEMKRGLSALATIGSTAPFVGLFGTVVGILNAFKGIETQKATGLSAVAGGIAEALVTTAFGLLVAVPAVWAYHYSTHKVEAV